ncbi:hypothetical protein [Flavobacterium sp.]|uniref:hypothetical protein n=1 Tax=Flavobacterium sp. TaxID=239 RepID=UPI003B9C6844
MRVDGEKLSETEKLFSNHNGNKKYIEGLQIISKQMERNGKTGCADRHFRREGKINDRTCALPAHLYAEGNKLRLYAIMISPNIVILGNGGIKTTKTYQEDPHLNDCMELLINLDTEIKKKTKQGLIVPEFKTLKGNLAFQI